MAFKPSKFDIGMVAAFVLVTGAGIGGYFYTASLVDTAQQEMNAAAGDLQKLVKEKYLPSDNNIKVLSDNIKQQRDVLQPIEDKVLQSPENPLSKIETENPVTWKNNGLTPTIQKLTTLAHSKHMSLPPDYFFGFARYHAANPPEPSTLILSKQLYGIEQLVTALIGSADSSGVTALREVRRTFDEDAGSSDFNSGNPSEAGDAIPGTVKTGSNGLYRAYPLEIEFTCNTTGLRAFLNNVNQLPVIFIVRSVQISNTRLDSPKVADLAKASDTRGTASSVGREFVFGAEQLLVRVRVDMVEWLGTKGAQPSKPTGKPTK